MRTRVARGGRAPGKLDQMLVCPVRIDGGACGLALVRDEKRVVCARGHSFDVARSGYINLLQPQDRRSKKPGDTDAAIQARRRLHDRGVTQPLLRQIGRMIRAGRRDITLDAGCGDGFFLASLAREAEFAAHGVDISVAAIDAAARRYSPNRPDQGRFEWIVANADRFVPYSDHSFTLVMTITGRMNPREFRRVLRENGRLLVAISAPDDLIELRGSGRDRVARTIEEFSASFALIDQQRATAPAELDAEGVKDVLHSIYRPLRSRPVEAMRVTFSLDLLLFRPK